MPHVVVQDKESLEHALKRFRKGVQKAGIMVDHRDHRHYVKPSTRRRLKSARARKRAAKPARQKLARYQ